VTLLTFFSSISTKTFASSTIFLGFFTTLFIFNTVVSVISWSSSLLTLVLFQSFDGQFDFMLNLLQLIVNTFFFRLVVVVVTFYCPFSSDFTYAISFVVLFSQSLSCLSNSSFLFQFAILSWASSNCLTLKLSFLFFNSSIFHLIHVPFESFVMFPWNAKMTYFSSLFVLTLWPSFSTMKTSFWLVNNYWYWLKSIQFLPFI
jgi:hypothetical protein